MRKSQLRQERSTLDLKIAALLRSLAPLPTSSAGHVAKPVAGVFDASGLNASTENLSALVEVLTMLMIDKTLAQQELECAEERLNLALAGSALAMWEIDVATGTIRGDLGWQKILGGSADVIDPTSLALKDLVHPDDHATSQHALIKALKGDDPYFHVEQRLRRHDGVWVWVNTHGMVTERDAQGHALKLLGTSRAITARKKVEQALIVAKNVAEEASAAKDTFLAAMSHEIRTPLNGLLGMLDLLSLTKLDQEQSQTLEIARTSGRDMGRIINDVLDHAKIEAGKLALLPEALSIEQLLERVVYAYYHAARAKNIELRMVVDPRISESLLADLLRLQQILGNFVSNAIKFTEQGYVEVRAELLGHADYAETLRLSVQDTGIGISLDAQQKLFQPFEQASVATARLYGGTGLGLFICRRLVNMMNGSIALQSTLGIGTTVSVTLTLPVTDATPAHLEMRRTQRSARLLVSPVATSPADAPLVLAVDDHPTNRLLLQSQLEVLGMHSHVAADGQEALTMWQRAPRGEYACVITDCNMPVMDGYALTRAIREIEQQEGLARTPIIAWTANAFAEAVSQCSVAGMDEVLVKPSDLVKLKAMLEKFLPAAAGQLTSSQAPQQALANNVTPDKSHEAEAAKTDITKTEIIDRSVLSEAMGGNETMVLELLRSFRNGLPKRVDALNAALSTGNLSAIQAAGHQFKGAAAMIGAAKLTAICQQIEAAARAGDAPSLAVLQTTFTDEVARVHAYLMQL